MKNSVSCVGVSREGVKALKWSHVPVESLIKVLCCSETKRIIGQLDLD